MFLQLEETSCKTDDVLLQGETEVGLLDCLDAFRLNNGRSVVENVAFKQNFVFAFLNTVKQFADQFRN